MVAPPAMLVEMAVDDLRNMPQKLLDTQTQEVRVALGQATCDRLKISFPLSPDFVLGYMIGLQVARKTMQCSVEMQSKGIDSSKVL